MKNRAMALAVAATCLSLGTAAIARPPAIDGFAEGAYGPSLAVQANPTGFGNATIGNPRFANGSELDQSFAVVDGGVLYLHLAGNLESNFNKLDIFIDSVAGGQNKLRGDNPNVDFNGLNRMGDDGSGNGLRFDAGVDMDYWVSSTGGDVGGGTYGYFVNYAQLLTGGGGAGAFLGGNNGAGALTGGANPDNIQAAIDNSNIGGVDNVSAAGANTVFTGMEFAIPLSAIGNPTGDICITAFINGGGHDFVSNQVLGSLPAGFGNLGEPRNVNLEQVAGMQCFDVSVPEPTSLGLIGLGIAGALRRRSR